MVEFVGRSKELGILEKSCGRPSAFLVYGRRRVGKTYLLRHFIEERRHIYVQCVEGTEYDNVVRFDDALRGITGTYEHGSFKDVLKDIGAALRQERTIVVLDEFQNLLGSVPLAVSDIQSLIDTDLVDSESMLILCGSAVRTMRGLAEDGNGPLFGRCRPLRVDPMPFEDIKAFHQNMSDLDCMKLYLTVGGIPRYHAEMRQDTYEGCIEENFLRDGWMTEETVNLISSEFSPPERHISVASAISGGATSLKEIADKVHVAPATCIDYLANLEKAGIVSRLNPMMDAPKRPLYYVSDDMFAFNFEVLVRRSTLISDADAKRSYRNIEHHIDAFLGTRFEHYCRRFLPTVYPISEIGKWWMDSREVHEDIDIVAVVASGDNKIQLMGECKFTQRPVGFHEYNKLDARAQRFRRSSNERLALISISGFDEELRGSAEGLRLILLGPDVIFGKALPPDV